MKVNNNNPDRASSRSCSATQKAVLAASFLTICVPAGRSSAQEFVFDTLTANSFTTSLTDNGTDDTITWSQWTDGSGSITTYGGNHLTMSLSGSANTSQGMEETWENGVGHYCASYIDMYAGCNWSWDGPPGESPAVTMITEFSGNGSISISGGEHVRGECSADSQGRAFSNLHAWDKDNDILDSANASRTTGGQPGFDSDNCVTLLNASENYIYTPLVNGYDLD